MTYSMHCLGAAEGQALATGLEVVVICCLLFVVRPMLIRGPQMVWHLAVTKQVESSASKPAANADGSLNYR